MVFQNVTYHGVVENKSLSTTNALLSQVGWLHEKFENILETNVFDNNKSTIEGV